MVRFNKSNLLFLVLSKGKIIQTEDVVRSVRPFSLVTESMDEDMQERVKQHLKPLCNVIYSQGSYYVY